MEMTLNPLVSVGPINLGDSRRTVRESVAEDPVEVSHPFAHQPIDHFYQSSIQVSYDVHDTAEHIEISAPLQVVLNGIALVGMRVGELIESLSNQGVAASLDADDPYSVYFLKLGLAVTPADTREMVSSVGVFRSDVFHLEDGTNWKAIE